MGRRRITVGSVGTPPPQYPGGHHSEAALVEQMVEFWRTQLAPVLLDRPDLVVLPELCDRFDGATVEQTLTLRPAMLAAMREAMAEVARDHSCHLVQGSAVPGPDGRWHNSALLFDRTGAEVGRYDKLRLVPGEEAYDLHPGRGPVVLDTDVGRIGFAICFDLNFVELVEQTRPLQPDVVVFPSRYHGGFMQRYWAHQLRSHFIGSVGVVNLTSDIWSPVGALVAGSTNYHPTVTTSINTNSLVAHLDGNRLGPLQALKAALGPDVTISDPGELGSVLITSERADLPVGDLAAEFGIETLDDYWARAREFNRHDQQQGVPA